MDQNKYYEKAEIKKLPDSEAEIVVTISEKTLEPYREKALNHLKEKSALPGFRKGKVPEKMIVERVGEMGILEEAAELAIKEAYKNIIVDNTLDVIGQPDITITKIAPGNPLEFKIIAPLFPEFDLPDYKTISQDLLKNKEIVIVTDEDIKKIILEIQKIHSPKKSEGSQVEETAPELTDEFVKTVGTFENVADFKEKVKDNLKKEKEFRVKEKIRLEIIGKIIEKSDIPVPRVLVLGELGRMYGQFSDDVKRMGGTVPEYLQKINKSEEGLKKEWEKDAKTRVRFELILDKIAKLENISADNEEVDKEADHIIEHYSKSDPEKVRTYVEHQLRNEEVFKFLEDWK